MFLCLSEHPDIYVPFIKQTHYFDREYHNGPEWYQRYFVACKGQKAIGEVTNNYLSDPQAPSRIHKDLGNVRLITCLRDPIGRAYSRYKHLYRKGALSVDFREALTSVPELINHGLYYTQLERYVRLFGQDNIQVIIFEEFIKDHLSHLRQMYRFLGVDDTYIPKAAGKKVVTEECHNPAFLTYTKFSASVRKNVLMARLIDGIKKTPLLPVVDSFFMKFAYSPTRPKVLPAENVPSMKPGDVRFLREKFDPQIDELEKMLKIDLSRWRKREVETASHDQRGRTF